MRSIRKRKPKSRGLPYGTNLDEAIDLADRGNYARTALVRQDSDTRNFSLQQVRTRKTGQKVQSSIPIRSISHFANFGTNNENVRSICQWPTKYFPIEPYETRITRKQTRQIRNNKDIGIEFDGKDTMFSFPVNKGDIKIDNILDKSKNVRVIALANHKYAEHAILLFISGGNVWSVGFGFMGLTQNEDDINFSTNVHNKLGHKGHFFETLQGALYTSDFLLGNWEQENYVIWAGYLNGNIKQKLKKYLNRVNRVTISAHGDFENDVNVDVTNNTILSIDQAFYTENASWITTDRQGRRKYNCIEWVKYILGEDLKCGLDGAPSSCNRLSPTDWDKLMKINFFYTDDKNNKILKNIQKKLLTTNIKTTIGRTARAIMNNPKKTAACAGATCAVGLAWGPTAIPLATAISKQIGIPACLATGAVCGVEAQRKFGQKVLNIMNAPSPSEMSRGGKKTRHKKYKKNNRNKTNRKKRKNKTKRGKRVKRKNKTKKFKKYSYTI